MRFWNIGRRKIDYASKTLVMAILNATPDSFSDGGDITSIDEALFRAEDFLQNGADILDIGGESTRPKSKRVSIEEEIKRVIPIIEAITKRFNVPVSIDTSKSEVAEKALGAGAEIINDISGLRFDGRMAEIAAKANCGLILMHLRGTFETMHQQKTVEDIFAEVSKGLETSISKAESYGLKKENLALDVGIGFSKTFEQNLELIAGLDKIKKQFSDFPILFGASRKSFIGKILDNADEKQRLFGTIAANVIAACNGADIVRVHDVKETVEALKVADRIRAFRACSKI